MSSLSLAEAATVLGKSERQVRYMINNGRLKAVKIGGSWVVESSDLPLDCS
jgi:excisionase family DNA binding protein